MTAAGNWIMTMQTPMGEQKPEVTLGEDGTGSMKSPMGEAVLRDVVFDGDAVSFASDMKSPMGRSRSCSPARSTARTSPAA